MLSAPFSRPFYLSLLEHKIVPKGPTMEKNLFFISLIYKKINKILMF